MTREEAIQVLKNTIAYESDFAEAKRLAIESLSADRQKYETFCGVPMEEAYKVMRGYSLGEYAEVVRCKDCRHRDLFSCPLADNDFQKDDDFCSWGERRERCD